MRRELGRLESLVIGPQGIRVAWRLLMFVLLSTMFALFLASILHLPGGARHYASITPGAVLIGEGTVLIAIVSAIAIMAKIEDRSFAYYAIDWQTAFGRSFWQGIVWGFLSITALLLMMKVGRGFSLGMLALHSSKLLYYAALWAVAFLAVGLVEEILFRSYALFTLSAGIGFWPAAILLSGIFGSIHLRNPGETWVGGISAGLIGLFFCFSVRRTGTLWFAVGLHSSWDYSESFIYSVPNSGAAVTGHLLDSSLQGPRWLTGGRVGPEGSILVFLIIAALFVLLDRCRPELKFPVSDPRKVTI